ncbi:DUF2812 domain-containing protein [Streptococcus caprae]|uniref:DUF2812 domain-containing protein n=1 Tax=Streptococcus caprae TaxID=1640501 RepID=A0ABV8CU87_9STRE
MKTKVEWKKFFITDFEQEERYLTEMHRKGWKFVRVRFGMFYHFEAVESAEVTYKLDFVQLKKAERESYLQMYADYGWENVARCWNFGFLQGS